MLEAIVFPIVIVELDLTIYETKVDRAAIGRLLLSNPDFPRQAAEKLGVKLEY